MEEKKPESGIGVGTRAKLKKGNKQMLTAVAVIVIAVIALIVYFAFYSTPLVAENGDLVSVYYQGSFTNGTVFGSNFNGTALNFTIGANELIPGFNNAVIGMRVGQIKKVIIPENEAYGPVNPNLIVSVPLTDFGNQTIKVGEVVTSSTGQEATIENISSNTVVLNLNSPLAGKTLVFEIKLLAIRK